MTWRAISGCPWLRDGTIGRLQSQFYRSKLTGWMAQQEENYRFILLQADPVASPWSQV